MTANLRESAMEALVSLLAGAYAWKTGPTRRLKLWSDVPAASRPACFLFEGGHETYTWTEGAVPKRVIDVKVFIYLNAKDPSVSGASLVNGVMDALDVGFALSGTDVPFGRKTFGGSVYNCRIDGEVLKDPGDLDGDALLIVPVKIILP
jgi:hypothetical protein